MQEQNRTFSTFLHRTDHLASVLKCQIGDLPEVLGVGRRTLFAGRKTDTEVSAKTWHKLEAAERAAGIGVDPEPEEDDPPCHSVPDDLHDRIARMETLLLRIAEKLDIPIEP